jgi:hypothetical protein
MRFPAGFPLQSLARAPAAKKKKFTTKSKTGKVEEAKKGKLKYFTYTYLACRGAAIRFFSTPRIFRAFFWIFFEKYPILTLMGLFQNRKNARGARFPGRLFAGQKRARFREQARIIIFTDTPGRERSQK